MSFGESSQEQSYVQNVPSYQHLPASQRYGYTIKPIMYYLTAFLGGAIIILTVAGLIIDLTGFGRNAAGSDAAGQLGSLAVAPFVAVYLLQMVLILAGIVWLIQKTKQWNKTAVILSAVVAPILLLWAASAVLPIFDDSPDAAFPGAPLLPVIVVALYWLIAGVIAYNDLKYRRQRAAIV